MTSQDRAMRRLIRVHTIWRNEHPDDEPGGWVMSPDVADQIAGDLGYERDAITRQLPETQLFGFPIAIGATEPPGTLRMVPKYGRVVPDAFLEEIQRMYLHESPYRLMAGGPTTYIRPSLRRRLAAATWSLRYRIAHAIYPFHEGDDE